MYCDGCGVRLDSVSGGYEVTFIYIDDVSDDVLNLCLECTDYERVIASAEGITLDIRNLELY